MLNRALLARGDATLCSLAAMTLSEDPSEPVRMAVAGHPPPLLVDGEAVIEATGSDPVLGAFPDSDWSLTRAAIEPGQQLVVITDGITEARGPEGRFGEDRLRAHLSGAGNPVLAVQRLEGSLHSFTEGRFEDDMAMLAIARASKKRSAVPTDVLIERLAPAGPR
jgi:serine phosphatase RsbU (regulator of sigma subunit)